jgi:hypothetical protein
MTFIGKPEPTPSPKLDASNIQGNFATWATTFSVNHVAMNDANQGKHNAIIMQNQASDPGVNNNYVVLFPKNVTNNLGTQSQLFVQVPKFLPTQFDSTTAINSSMQLTYNQVNTSGPIYQSFLAGGYVIYFGSSTGSAASSPISITITVSPSPTKLLTAFATSNNMTTNGTSIPIPTSINILNSTQFTINSAPSSGVNYPFTYSFTWMAIGTQ